MGVQQLISPCYCSKHIVNAEQALQSAEDMDGMGVIIEAHFFGWKNSALNCKFRFTLEINGPILF